MVVDSHVHVFCREVLPDANRWSFARWAATRRVPNRDPADIYPRVGIRTWDPEAEDLLEWMDFCGIDTVVNLVTDWGLTWGEEPEWDIWKVNQFAADLRQKLPAGRYQFACGVDPRRYNASEVVEKAVKEWGAVALKLLPCTGFYPNDAVCYPIYETVQSLGIPIVMHTGHGDVAPYPMQSHPFNVADVARDFPKLNIILAHAGGGIDGLWREANLIGFLGNIYFDVSAWQNHPSFMPTDQGPALDEEAIKVLHVFRGRWGCEKILFGTDYIKGLGLSREATWNNDRYYADFYRELPERAKKFGYGFSREETDLMLEGNAKRLFKLE